MAYQPDVIVDKIPGHIEEMTDAFITKTNALIETAMAVVGRSGNANLGKALEDYKGAVTQLQDSVKDLIGNEGDKLDDTGSMWAQYGAAKVIKEAMGV